MHNKILPVLAALLIITLLVPGAVDAKRKNQSNTKQWQTSSHVLSAVTSSSTRSSGGVVAVKPTPIVTPTPVIISTPVTTPSSPSNELTLSAYVTGYSYWDNTPAGTAQISNPVIHQQAGGTGTYADPITLAVGHSIINGKDILDYPAGTKFYMPYLQKYAIVEDTCGDGNSPQNGPCHTGYQGHPWIDLYVDGANTSRAASDTCMNNITDVHTVIQNPKSTYPVTPGSVTGSGCKMF